MGAPLKPLQEKSPIPFGHKMAASSGCLAVVSNDYFSSLLAGKIGIILEGSTVPEDIPAGSKEIVHTKMFIDGTIRWLYLFERDIEIVGPLGSEGS
jgi:hypothetical protein